MGRLNKAKTDEIRKLRQQGYTQKETAGKAGVHVRTVRKYDPLREQRPVGPTSEQVKAIEEACIRLAAQGLAEESGGRFRITSLGTKTFEKYEELRERAILEFLAEQDRPVREAEIERYVDGVDDELFYEALNEVKRQRS